MSQRVEPYPSMPLNTTKENWQPTMHLGFIKSVLHQQWISTLGRVTWIPVPPIDPTQDPF